MLHQNRLSTPIPRIHPSDLGHCGVTLVHHHQIFIPKEIHQGMGFLSGTPPVEMTTVILNSAAGPHLLHQIQIILGPHFEPLRFQQLSGGFKLGDPLGEFLPNGHNRPPHFVFWSHIVTGGSQNLPSGSSDFLTGRRFIACEPVNRIPQKLNTDSGIFMGQ